MAFVVAKGELSELLIVQVLALRNSFKLKFSKVFVWFLV